ncbi:MAG: hypothetical protein ACE5E7_01650 [Anaerolineae bacterium]
MSRLEKSLSPALLEAQQKLLSVREERQTQQSARRPVSTWDSHGRSLGALISSVTTSSAPASPPHPTKLDTVKLYPDIALGMLREEVAAAGRIWLLLRYLDKTGSGRVDVELARAQFARRQSPLRVCGWRQLRNLFTQGDNIFWQRRDGRLWLRSVTRVAAVLHVPRLTHRPVSLPVAVLTQGIGAVRAHFYASFHSGRPGQMDKGKHPCKPIARATMEKLSHVNRRTQRLYEKRAGVRLQRNFALGPNIIPARMQEYAWRHGRASFDLCDVKGKQGKRGKHYLAWQLPNSYIGPHAQQPRGRQKRINQQLADLFTQGMTGNDELPVMGNVRKLPKRFYGNGRLAAQACQQQAVTQVYWRCLNHGRPPGGNRLQFWFSIANMK